MDRFLEELSINHRIYIDVGVGDQVIVGEWIGKRNKPLIYIGIGKLSDIIKYRNLIGFSIRRNM